VERLNPVTQTWSLVAPMHEERRGVSAIILPDGIYVVGGFNGKEYLKTMLRYDILLNKWFTLPPMIQKRAYHQVTVSPDCRYMFVMGGFDGTNSLRSVEKYDIVNAKWECTSSMMIKRMLHTSDVVSA
jgi:hypothetical protein